jgi:hypothetical protein
MSIEPFIKFRQYYQPDSLSKPSSINWSLEELEKFVGSQATAFSEFLRVVAYTSHGEGIIRFLLPGQPPPLSLHYWNSDDGWKKSWAEHKDRLCVFAYDWLGRQIAFDRQRVVAGELMIAILEPGTGEILEIPTNFIEFVEEELIEYHDAALASNFFQEWRTNGGSVPEPDQCVGYKIPLFLGGADIIDNLEIIDMDVYVTLCGQLFEGSLSLSIGEKISEINVDRD